MGGSEREQVNMVSHLRPIGYGNLQFCLASLRNNRIAQRAEPDRPALLKAPIMKIVDSLFFVNIDELSAGDRRGVTVANSEHTSFTSDLGTSRKERKGGTSGGKKGRSEDLATGREAA